MKTSIMTPSILRIGDPLYFESYSGKRLHDLIFEQKFPKTYVSSLEIVRNSKDGIATVRICIAPDAKTLVLYETDRYPAHFNVKAMELGCDTACFTVETQDRYVDIGTMADGYFGSVNKFTFNRRCQGAIITICLDNDIFDVSITRDFYYVFEKEK
jgi:hypothetical protein